MHLRIVYTDMEGKAPAFISTGKFSIYIDAIDKKVDSLRCACCTAFCIVLQCCTEDMTDETVDKLRVFGKKLLVMVAVGSSQCIRGVQVFRLGTCLRERLGMSIVNEL